MNPNSKIESYLDCGHELVCKPRASTTAGPTDGAARDLVARGAGGRTGSGASEELAAMEHRPTFLSAGPALHRVRRRGQCGSRMRQVAGTRDPRAGA